MKINKYPDKTSYVEISLFQPRFTFKINSYEDLWHLNQIIDVYNHKGITPTVIVPNLIDAQADRRFSENQSFGLRLVLKFLNSLDAKFEIFHPHNQEVVESILDNVRIIDNVSFIKDCLDQIYCEKYDIEQDKGIHYFIRKEFSDNVILFSSDAGGFKPLIKLADKLNWRGETFSASKARSWDAESGTKFVQQIDKADFEGKDILIVDDICVYGGTFKGLSKMLKERNCGKLYLAVSHMTVQDLGKDPVTNYFDTVFTTNSKFDFYFYDVDGLPTNLKILKFF